MSRVDDIIGLIDGGLQTSSEHGYSRNDQPGRCVRDRCHTGTVADSDFCGPCRAFMLGDTDQDPAEQLGPEELDAYLRYLDRSTPLYNSFDTMDACSAHAQLVGAAYLASLCGLPTPEGDGDYTEFGLAPRTAWDTQTDTRRLRIDNRHGVIMETTVPEPLLNDPDFMGTLSAAMLNAVRLVEDGTAEHPTWLVTTLPGHSGRLRTVVSIRGIVEGDESFDDMGGIIFYPERPADGSNS